MQSRRYIGMTISALLIVVLLLVFTDPWSSLRRDSKRIALRDPSAIDRIVIVDSYDSSELVRVEEEWLLYGDEKVAGVAIENLLFAAERLQISSIVSGENEAVDETGRRIRYYKGDKALMSLDFRIHGELFMVAPAGSEQAFYVSVAGYPGLNLDKVFSSASNHYREHILIDLLPSEISTIEIELSDGTGFRFVQDQDGNIECSSINEDTFLPAGEPDDLSTRLLFSYFTSIRYETKAHITADFLTTAHVANPKIARLHVESFGGDAHTLHVFPYHESPEAEAHMFKALVIYNNDPDALVVNYIYLDVLMRDLSHYFGEK